MWLTKGFEVIAAREAKEKKALKQEAEVALVQGTSLGLDTHRYAALSRMKEQADAEAKEMKTIVANAVSSAEEASKDRYINESHTIKARRLENQKNMLNAVQADGMAIELGLNDFDAAEEANLLYAVVHAAVLQNGMALQFAPRVLQDEETIVGAAVRQNGLAIEFASARLQAFFRSIAIKQCALTAAAKDKKDEKKADKAKVSLEAPMGRKELIDLLRAQKVAWDNKQREKQRKYGFFDEYGRCNTGGVPFLEKVEYWWFGTTWLFGVRSIAKQGFCQKLYTLLCCCAGGCANCRTCGMRLGALCDCGKSQTEIDAEERDEKFRLQRAQMTVVKYEAVDNSTGEIEQDMAVLSKYLATISPDLDIHASSLRGESKTGVHARPYDRAKARRGESLDSRSLLVRFFKRKNPEIFFDHGKAETISGEVHELNPLAGSDSNDTTDPQIPSSYGGSDADTYDARRVMSPDLMATHIELAEAQWVMLKYSKKALKPLLQAAPVKKEKKKKK
jgi:hypothetical protein